MSMLKITDIRIVKLDRPAGGWPNSGRPLKWAAVGPDDEIQKFETMREAIGYRRVRLRAVNQFAAVVNFS